MICINCGKELDNDIRVCPFCGNLVEPYVDHEYYEEAAPVYEEEVYEDDYAEEDDYEQHEFVDDDPVYAAGRKAKTAKKFSMPKVSVPNVSGIPLSTVLSALCCLVSIICLFSIRGMKNEMMEQYAKLGSNMNSVYASVAALDERLVSLDATVAGVQDEAYNQLASQSIIISKDITALTGPVTEGKYNIMFIINAKGNLNLSSSFDWQKYNEATGGWVSIVFTGNATSNEQYGLRLENTYDNEEGHYVSTLWANGITPEAEGTYRCVIKDATGITKTSAEATVQVG